MRVKKPKKTYKGTVMKEDVLQVIQNYIRSIQMNDYGKDEGISQLYNAMEFIAEMPLAEPVTTQEDQAYAFPEHYLWE